MVYVGSYDGRLYALDASKGNLVWDYATGDMFVSSPAVVNGIVYVGSFDHVIYAFGASPNEQTNLTSFSVVLVFLLLAILVATAALAVWYLRRKH